MKETLLVYTILLDSDLTTISEYKDHLDELFLKNSDDDLLLELEWSITDFNKSKMLIHDYFINHDINHDIFGSFLMQKLKPIYISYDTDIKAFEYRMLELWQKLPSKMMQKEPFWKMSYAGEPLTWGDINQTRELYEEMLNFYCTDAQRN